MKIEAIRKIRVGKAADGNVREVQRGDTADADEKVGEGLIKRELAKRAAGRPTGGQGQGGGSKPNAQTLIAEIGDSTNLERLRELAEDSRTSVAKAATDRIAVVEEQEILQEIAGSEDLDRLQELANDERENVAAAANYRLVERSGNES